MALAVAVMSALFKAPWLARTVITPLTSDEPPCTYFVLEMAHPLIADLASAVGELCNDSVIDVRQDDAARMTSDTFARTV